MSETKFGIEIETCVCDFGVPIDPDKNISYVEKLNAVSRENGIDVRFYFDSQPKAIHAYKDWLITTDSSIRCSSRYSNSYSHKEFYPLNTPAVCDFRSYEIVTPILNYTPAGISNLRDILEKVLFYKDFLYEIDDSQGLHINISNPEQDKLKFLMFWLYFEQVILNFVPYARRYSEYAKPLLQQIGDIDDLIEEWETFYNSPNEGPGKYSAVSVKDNRFEIRIVNADMRPDHMINWVSFLATLLDVSIHQELAMNEDDQMGSFEELFNYINNPVLKAYFGKIYQDNTRIYKSIETAIIGGNITYVRENNSSLDNRFMIRDIINDSFIEHDLTLFLTDEFIEDQVLKKLIYNHIFCRKNENYNYDSAIYLVKNFKIKYSFSSDLMDCIYDLFVKHKNKEILKLLSDDSVAYPAKIEHLITLLSIRLENKDYLGVERFLRDIELKNINKIPIELRLKVLDLSKQKPRRIFTTARILEELTPGIFDVVVNGEKISPDFELRPLENYVHEDIEKFWNKVFETRDEVYINDMIERYGKVDDFYNHFIISNYDDLYFALNSDILFKYIGHYHITSSLKEEIFEKMDLKTFKRLIKLNFFITEPMFGFSNTHFWETIFKFENSEIILYALEYYSKFPFIVNANDIPVLYKAISKTDMNIKIKQENLANGMIYDEVRASLPKKIVDRLFLEKYK